MLNTRAAASKLGCSPNFLEKLRVSGGGPVYVKIGKAVRYEAAALDEWVAGRRFRCTAEEAEARSRTARKTRTTATFSDSVERGSA